MPRKQRFKPSRKPKPNEESAPMGNQQSANPGQMIPNERERDDARTTPADRSSDVVIDHDRPR